MLSAEMQKSPDKAVAAVSVSSMERRRGSSRMPYPSLQAQQDAGAAAAWFPALTTMAGLG
jgi:hypothetical protein